MGATAGWLLCITTCTRLLLNPTPQKIFAITVSYMHYVVCLDAIGGVYVV
jgi:hypothetical protein